MSDGKEGTIADCRNEGPNWDSRTICFLSGANEYLVNVKHSVNKRNEDGYTVSIGTCLDKESSKIFMKELDTICRNYGAYMETELMPREEARKQFETERVALFSYTKRDDIPLETVSFLTNGKDAGKETTEKDRPVVTKNAFAKLVREIDELDKKLLNSDYDKKALLERKVELEKIMKEAKVIDSPKLSLDEQLTKSQRGLVMAIKNWGQKNKADIRFDFQAASVKEAMDKYVKEAKLAGFVYKKPKRKEPQRVNENGGRGD